MKLEHESSQSSAPSYPMDKLLEKLSEQQAVLEHQSKVLKYNNDELMFPRSVEGQSPCPSVSITPGTETHVPMASSTRSASMTPIESQPDELLFYKYELAKAQNKISHLDQELAQTRFEQQLSSRTTPLNGAGFATRTTSPVNSHFMNAPSYATGSKPSFTRDGGWAGQEDCRSETSDALPAGGFHRAQGIWSNKPSFQGPFPPAPVLSPVPDGTQMPWSSNRSFSHAFGEPNHSYGPQGPDNFRHDRITSEHDMVKPMNGRRGGNRYENRLGTAHGSGPPYGGYNVGAAHYDQGPAYPNVAPGAVGMGGGYPYQHQPIGTNLSPHAAEFTSARPPWKTEVKRSTRRAFSSAELTRLSQALPANEGQTYLPATEPLNYRRLLDRNVTCDWKYIVDKIVCNNDQQASIFLQQKLKVGTPEQKYDIVEAIVAQAYPLMVNRFGNFLVQRCFEHGTPEQVIKIAEAIRGHTLNLSMDPFGCHVVQKAFDSVPEDYKAIMVHELLRRIPETVIHRYACHVWQKLFELRWSESPPQIMKYVNDALRGMWHEVALGETGSLVVQNIFENCLEEDKVNSDLSYTTRSTNLHTNKNGIASLY